MELQERHQDIVNELIAYRDQKAEAFTTKRKNTLKTATPLQRPKKSYNRVINRLPWENEVPHLAAKFHSVTVLKAEFELIATHKQKYLLAVNNDYGQNDTIKISCGNQEILAFITSIGRGDNKSILSIAVWSIKRGNDGR